MDAGGGRIVADVARDRPRRGQGVETLEIAALRDETALIEDVEEV